MMGVDTRRRVVTETTRRGRERRCRREREERSRRRTRTVCTIARTIITEDAWRRRRAIERFESLTWTCARGTGEEESVGGANGRGNGRENVDAGAEGGARGTHVATIAGHDGPVWACAWAHPKFGTLLASASFDHHVMIHKETEPNVFTCAYKTPVGTHDGSVNAISWAPHEHGRNSRVRVGDGTVSVISYDASAGTWSVEKIERARTPWGARACRGRRRRRRGRSWAPAARRVVVGEEIGDVRVR